MFGRMMIEPVVQLGPGVDLQTAIATLIKVAENVEIVRWIELPTSVLLFLLVPGDPDSGAVYVLDRKKGTWYAVDFDDEQFGGYSVSQLEMLLKECNFLDLIERPGLWRAGLQWVVLPGMRPDRKNIPGYLTTPTSENRVGKWRTRAPDSRVCQKEVTSSWLRQSRQPGRSSRITKGCS